jgi:hypothetical protein
MPFNESVPFFCDVNGPGARSAVPPQSVHKVTPGDIDIIASMGDSLSAANGVWSAGGDPPSILIEGKGISFASGGLGNWRKVRSYQISLKNSR